MPGTEIRRPLIAGWLIGFLATWAAAQMENTLTPAESTAGYDLLFNGSDLNDWHAYRSTELPGNSFAVKTDGPLGPRFEIVPGRQPILTDKKFRNFDLKVDVKVPSIGVSGIFTRYEEISVDPNHSASGPWFLLCSPESGGECGGNGYSFGASYDLFRVEEPLRFSWHDTAGTWNRVRIIAYDSNYVHYGNGKKLLEYKIGTPEFFEAYNRSKFAYDGNNGRYYDIHFGGFMIQHHGEPGFAFRNFKAKELEVHPFRREFPDGSWPDSLPQDFVFGTAPSAFHGERIAQRGFTSRRSGSGETLLQFASPPTDLRAAGIDGRAMQLRDLGRGVFAIPRQERNPGIIFLRFTLDGKPRTGTLVP